jgi:DNA-binding NarL/FixJ family response regulator
MRVLIADDQAEVRSALRVLLEQENEFYVLDEAEDVNSLLVKVKNGQPELVLLDWELSKRTMAETIPLLRQLIPGLSIIALSGRPEAKKAAIGAGVDMFVSKGENSDRLLDAINAIKV